MEKNSSDDGHDLPISFAPLDGPEDKDRTSDYFMISIEEGADLQRLATTITLPFDLQKETPRSRKGIYIDSIADQLNQLYLLVNRIMDIRFKRFKIEVRISKNAESLRRVLEMIGETRLREGGFYAVSMNILFIDAENITVDILGHELAHAIQAHYFVVPPPARIQELLAHFVEIELKNRIASSNF